MKKNGSKKIMVVDDNEDMIYMLSTVLKKDGYKVVGATSGEECLRRVNTDKPDLILLDIMMPGIDGWEVCKRIKESGLFISVPISMLSVRKDEEDFKKSLQYAHADAHLTKPVNFEELRKTVESLLA
jgi:CheY-like chemotaxis protein